MKIKILCFSFVLFVFSFQNGLAQNETKPADAKAAELKIHTIYIYNFTKYIQWPAATLEAKEFVIGILGETDLYNELSKMAAVKTVNGKKIIIKKIQTPKEGQDCPIVFLPLNSSDMLSKALSTFNKRVLIITQKPGMAKTGSFINFVNMDGRPKFEMNISAFERSELKIQPQIKSIAIIIE